MDKGKKRRTRSKYIHAAAIHYGCDHTKLLDDCPAGQQVPCFRRIGMTDTVRGSAPVWAHPNAMRRTEPDRILSVTDCDFSLHKAVCHGRFHAGGLS